MSSSVTPPDQAQCQISAACQRFEKCWQAGPPRPRLEDFLAEAKGPVWTALLRELLSRELSYRQAAGEAVLLQVYQERFPGHEELLAEVFRCAGGSVPGTLASAAGPGPDPHASSSHATRADEPTACPLGSPGVVGEASSSFATRANAPTEYPTQDEFARFPAGAPAASSPQVHVPGYDIVGELGRGGMGVVYKARQEGLDRLVALKMILQGGHATASALLRFRSEALVIARLQHPNIVQVYAVGDHDGLPFFALELCSGGSLAQHFASQGPMPAATAAALLGALARAVQAAHQAGIVHRDLKPANILLTLEGTPKVTDFGLSKQLDSADGPTQSGAVMGTPSYMAPEQAAGQTHVVGPATDIYALGAILYEALSGRPPFKAATVMETIGAVLGQEPPLLRSLCPHVPRDLEAIVFKCLDKDPTHRYASAAALADDLERWQRGEPVVARRQSPLYRLCRRLQRNRRKILAGAGVAVLLFLTWLSLADGGVPVPGSAGVQEWLDDHDASLFRPAPTEATLRAAAAEQRRTLVTSIQDTALSKEGWVAPIPSSRDHTDAWTQMQAAAALLVVPEADREKVRRCVSVFDRLFEPSPMCDAFIPGYGWPNFNDGLPSAEACGWALSVIGRALAAADVIVPAARQKLLKRLDEVQAALDNCRSRDKRSGKPSGGWNLFAHQEDPGQANIYVTVLVGQGLLDLRRAGLPWHQSQQQRDRLLTDTLSWLVRHFYGQGWTTPGRLADDINDGLTLQIFTLLLRAEADGLLTLPADMAAQIPRHLAECGSRPLDYQITVALFSVPFRDPLGKIVPRPQRPVRMLWHPWAIGCAALWLHRCERTAAPHYEIVRTRRVLGHLVLTLGDKAIRETQTGYTYITAETLMGLAAIDGP
jgi:hypothetical protein